MPRGGAGWRQGGRQAIVGPEGGRVCGTAGASLGCRRIPRYTSQVDTTALSDVIRQTLTDFEEWLVTTAWRGKEADCVNAYAHGFLLPAAVERVDGFDPMCLGIEVGVPQAPGHGKNKAVRRDLLVWREPGQTTWDASWNAVELPAVIIEWKARRKGRAKLDSYDLEWLRKVSAEHADFTGWAVTVDFTGEQAGLLVARVEGGEVEEETG